MPKPAGVKIQQLTYRFPRGRMALSNIDLDVSPGERIALLGPNGAGKSTLLLHLNGLLPGSNPNDANGSVSIDGEVVTQESLRSIRPKVGLLFQNPDDQLFSPTVGEDVRFGPEQLRLSEEEITRRTVAGLASVGLAGFEARSPNELSLGEKKRACLAGVLVCEPGVLALDEPTASLDPRGRGEIIRLLLSLDQTMIVATHDLQLARTLCPRSVILDAGEICADGPTDEILNHRDLLERHGLTSEFEGEPKG